MAPEMHKNAQKCSKSWVEFPATTRGYSMVKIARPNDAFLEGFLSAQ